MIAQRISELRPGERVAYDMRRSGAGVLALAEMDETIVLTQQKIDGKFIYYANKISLDSAEILERLKYGENIHTCFWKSNIP